MKSKLLKLDKPYNVIYAGGKVGKHIATLMVWNEVDDEEDGVGIMDAVSYPVIDEGEEFPAGTLCDNVELHDCRVICSEIKKANIFWLAKIIEYDFRQIEPAGADYILERLKLLGTKIAMPTEKDEKTGREVLMTDFDLSLNIWKVSGPIGEDDKGVFRVNTLSCQGFYFEAMGTPEEIFNELEYQKNVYHGAFYEMNIYIKITFHSYDGYIEDVIKRLNESVY
jgi:hypothetical protein